MVQFSTEYMFNQCYIVWCLLQIQLYNYHMYHIHQ